MGEVEAACATAVAGLHAIHVQVDVVSQPIDVLRFDRLVVVVATEKVAAYTLSLPPAVPKASLTSVNKVGSPSYNPSGCNRGGHEVRCECHQW